MQVVRRKFKMRWNYFRKRGHNKANCTNAKLEFCTKLQKYKRIRLKIVQRVDITLEEVYNF